MLHVSHSHERSIDFIFNKNFFCVRLLCSILCAFQKIFKIKTLMLVCRDNKSFKVMLMQEYRYKIINTKVQEVLMWFIEQYLHPKAKETTLDHSLKMSMGLDNKRCICQWFTWYGQAIPILRDGTKKYYIRQKPNKIIQSWNISYFHWLCIYILNHKPYLAQLDFSTFLSSLFIIHYSSCLYSLSPIPYISIHHV